jgi:thiosulfate dehydrogenase (quinone) large subunit
MGSSRFDFALAHALARVGLGLNIAGHGFSRIGNVPGFARGIAKMFDRSLLPPDLVFWVSHIIPPAELIIGVFILLGFFLRPSLILGLCTLFLLTLGTTIVQDWEAASTQLVYIAFFSGLLATVSVSRFTLDRWLLPMILHSAPDNSISSEESNPTQGNRVA